MAWATAHDYVVFTHDLDFGTILAVTSARGPSVIQVRAQDVTPEHLRDVVANALAQFRIELETGALVTVDEDRRRARILPLSPG